MYLSRETTALLSPLKGAVLLFNIGEVVKGKHAGTFRVLGYRKVGTQDMVELKEVHPVTFQEGPNPPMCLPEDALEALPCKIQKTARDFALKHSLRLGRLSNGHYFLTNEQGEQTHLSMYPTAQSAVVMMRKARRGA